MNEGNWYGVDSIINIDSPALLIYKQRVKDNIQILLSMIDDPARLRPHIKTHKTSEAVLLCMEAGIRKFKCATIAEAELLAICGAPDILLAYQPSGPKLERLINLINAYPKSAFSCLIDNQQTAVLIGEKALAYKHIMSVYIDLNVGMNRTGIQPAAALELYEACAAIPGIAIKGLHAYDGHIHASDLEERTRLCDDWFTRVEKLVTTIIEKGYPAPVIVAGGSPSFPIHAKRKRVECSPGTFIYWDKGYLDSFTEQHFKPAALVLTRVISMPGENLLCLDLGYKAIASENALANRIAFLNAPELLIKSQSEEHLVVDAGPGHPWKIGDVLYGIPVHICPTIAMYESANIIEGGVKTASWNIIARNRSINY